MAEQRSGFAPTVGLGLASAALASVAAAKPWFTIDGDRSALQGVPPSERVIDMPLALALSLVVLAGWGAVLVSRGRWRRALVAISLAAAVGVVVCVASAPLVLPDDLRHGLTLPTRAAARPTGWFVTAAVAAVLSAIALLQAWRLAPRWPTMSSRYDAPATGHDQADDSTDASADQLDLWKALDQGHDPTDPSRGAGSTSP